MVNRMIFGNFKLSRANNRFENPVLDERIIKHKMQRYDFTTVFQKIVNPLGLNLKISKRRGSSPELLQKGRKIPIRRTNGITDKDLFKT